MNVVISVSSDSRFGDRDIEGKDFAHTHVSRLLNRPPAPLTDQRGRPMSAVLVTNRIYTVIQKQLFLLWS